MLGVELGGLGSVFVGNRLPPRLCSKANMSRYSRRTPRIPHANPIPHNSTAEVIDADGSGTLALACQVALGLAVRNRGTSTSRGLTAEVHSI